MAISSRRPGVPILAAFVFAAAAAALVASGSATLQAQNAADLFDTQRLHEVRLTVHPRDLALLRQNYELNTFYAATATWDGIRIRDVAIRSRGLGSRNPTKLGIEIDFDRYVARRRVAGLSSLVLDNLWQDASMVREAMALAMFHRAGIPASRAAFSRVYINNEFQGLYATVEPIDPEFLGRVYNDAAGYLYEYKWLYDFRATYPGDDLEAYKPLFEPRNREDESDEALYGPLRDLFRVVNQSDEAVWRAEVEQRLDLGQLVRYVALEGYLGDNDGFLGYAGLNNHYWYRPSDSGRHKVIGWDKDRSFDFIDASMFRGVDENELMRRALAQPDLYTAFLDASVELASLAGDDDWFANELERVVALITPVAVEDRLKKFSIDELIEDVNKIRTFAQIRPAMVRDEVAGRR